jgi:hypothetical protein
MLARQLRHHPARTAADLAAGLSAARDRLAAMRAENLSVAAAFDLSYQDLTTHQQRLFCRLGLAPGPDIDAYAAAALDDTGVATARDRLDELYDHHLITEPASGRYLLHDLLREYARTLAAADDTADGVAAAGRLVSYYAHAGGSCRFRSGRGLHSGLSADESCGHSCGSARVVHGAAAGDSGASRMTQEGKTMTETQIWRVSRIQPAHGQASTVSGTGRRSRRAALRLWTLMHAQALLNGTTGDAAAFIEDDRRRLAARRAR